MASFALALPILAGKTAEWRRFIVEVTGPRRSETEVFHRRFGFTKANWFLHQTPRGDIAIIYVEGNDPKHSFQKWGESDHPYDLWFKQQLGPFYGIDFNQLAHGTPPRQVFEWQAR